MPQVVFCAVSVTKQVRHKPDELRITTQCGDVSKIFCMPTKISEKAIKRRCNDTLQLGHILVPSQTQSGEQLRMAAAENGFMFEVMTKGGQTEGRQKQHYLLLQRNATYRVDTMRDDEFVVSIDLLNQQAEILNLWQPGALAQPVVEPPNMWKRVGEPKRDEAEMIPPEFSGPLFDAARFFERESTSFAFIQDTLAENSDGRWDTTSSDEFQSDLSRDAFHDTVESLPSGFEPTAVGIEAPLELSRAWSMTSETSSLHSARSGTSDTERDPKETKPRFTMSRKHWDVIAAPSPFWVTITSSQAWQGTVAMTFGGNPITEVYLSSNSATFAVPAPPVAGFQPRSCLEVDVEVFDSTRPVYFTTFTYSFGSSMADDTTSAEDEHDECRSRKRSKFTAPVRMFTNFDSLSSVFNSLSTTQQA